VALSLATAVACGERMDVVDRSVTLWSEREERHA
jgi:hypothetical protein